MFTGGGTGITKTYSYNDIKACLSAFSITTITVPDNTPDSAQLNTIQVDSQGNQWFCDSYGDLTKIEHQIIPETDPLFMASAAQTIALGDITNWNTAYGWGNHASAGYITLGSLSANLPLTYNSLSGVFSMLSASASVDGYLSAIDWNTFNGKQNTTLTSGNIWVGDGSNVAASVSLSLNASTGAFSLSNAGVMTIPDANATTRGFMNTTTQTFAGSKTFTNNAHTAAVFNGTWTSSADGQAHVAITPSITANANNRILYALNINPTFSNGGFSASLIDLNFGKNNPLINWISGNLSIQFQQSNQVVIRASNGGVLGYKLKLGNLLATVTNTLDVGGDSLFGAASVTPSTAGARVHIVGANASAGSYSLLVTNSTPTTLFRIENNQDVWIGSAAGKIGLFAVTPIARPTTAIGSAAFISPGGGTNIKTDDTFDGYTIAKVVKALRDLGALT
jgi:hypothetical protein